jgi:spore coat polysaccharide biosynthesis predicted glycosyltransferase SpsG
MAITSGGLTAFEACASGLPTIVIANETHEISNANYLEKIGCARYAGMHTGINKDILMCDLDIERMSMSGMTQLNTQGINNVMECILAL